MLHELNERIVVASEHHARLLEVHQQLERARKERARLARGAADARARLAEGAGTIRKLEGRNLRALFLRLLGKHAEALAQEKQELVRARSTLDQLEAGLEERDQEIASIESGGHDLSSAREELDALLARKEHWIGELGGEAARELRARSEEERLAREELSELEEVVLTAKQARRELDRCAERLSLAGNWGLLDLAGGGFLTSLMKRGKVDEANEAAAAAERALRRLEHELRGLRRHDPLGLEQPGLERFGDLFLDGLLFDWMTQSKIHRSKQNVAHARHQLGRLHAQLVAREDELRQQWSRMVEERRHWVENWI